MIKLGLELQLPQLRNSFTLLWKMISVIKYSLLVGKVGFEPTSQESKSWILPLDDLPLVAATRLELVSLSAADFKSAVSTYFTKRPNAKH